MTFGRSREDAYPTLLHEMEDDMEDQSLYVDEEQQTAARAGLARKLLKREQRLLGRLQEAQEAEARALDRFRRVQARLQRRSARLERIKNHLSLVRQQIADLQPEPAEPALEVPSTPELAPVADSEVIAPPQTEPEPAISDAPAVIAGPSEPEVVPISESTSEVAATPPETETIPSSAGVLTAPDRIEQEVDVE